MNDERKTAQEDEDSGALKRLDNRVEELNRRLLVVQEKRDYYEEEVGDAKHRLSYAMRCRREHRIFPEDKQQGGSL